MSTKLQCTGNLCTKKKVFYAFFVSVAAAFKRFVSWFDDEKLLEKFVSTNIVEPRLELVFVDSLLAYNSEPGARACETKGRAPVDRWIVFGIGHENRA